MAPWMCFLLLCAIFPPTLLNSRARGVVHAQVVARDELVAVRAERDREAQRAGGRPCA